jgi:hypothetical protein
MVVAASLPRADRTTRHAKDSCRQADLPHRSAHGIRKATSPVLAEAGATPHEIMAITGDQTLEKAERYTKAANRKNWPTWQWQS